MLTLRVLLLLVKLIVWLREILIILCYVHEIHYKIFLFLSFSRYLIIILSTFPNVQFMLIGYLSKVEIIGFIIADLRLWWVVDFVFIFDLVIVVPE